jgi:hypothetical protein
MNPSIPTTPFDLKYICSLVPDKKKRNEDEEEDEEEVKQVYKNTQKAKEYLISYFVPLSNGNHAFYDYNVKKFVIQNKQQMDMYFDKIPNALCRWFKCKYLGIRDMVYELNQPVFIGNKKLNMCPSLKHVYSPYGNFSPDIQKKWKSSNRLF